MKTRLIIGSVATAAFVAGSFTAALNALDRSEPSPLAKRPTVNRVETVDATDLADDRKLVGLAHDVFLGRVVRERGRTIAEPAPEVQYDVQVLRAIKGGLSGIVVVSQQGGVDERGDVVIVEDDLPLRAGRVYVFATRTNPSTGWHTAIPKYGDLRVDSVEMQALLVQRFAAAHAAEIPFRPR
jgi:hypothetical protein